MKKGKGWFAAAWLPLLSLWAPAAPAAVYEDALQEEAARGDASPRPGGPEEAAMIQAGLNDGRTTSFSYEENGSLVGVAEFSLEFNHLSMDDPNRFVVEDDFSVTSAGEIVSTTANDRSGPGRVSYFRRCVWNPAQRGDVLHVVVTVRDTLTGASYPAAWNIVLR